MFNFKAEFYLKVILMICSISLISAYFIEYVLGHQPCNLCLIERIPYVMGIVFIIASFIFERNKKFLILLLILTFIFSFAISIYHYGIEQGFFEEPTVCSAKNFSETITKEDLLKELNEKNISCKDVTFRIFGLSLTSINIVVSLLFIMTLSKIYTQYEKNRY